MIKLSKGAGAVVASDVQAAVAAMDQALLTSARVCVSFLEATQGANIPVHHSQKVLRSVSDGLNRVVEGRAGIASAITYLATIQARSNLAEEAYGCPLPWDDANIFAPSGSLAAAEPRSEWASLGE